MGYSSRHGASALALWRLDAVSRSNKNSCEVVPAVKSSCGAPRQAACDAGSYCGGRCCASTPLRCSATGRAAELATRSFGALRSNSCGKSVHEACVCPSAHARRPAPCASRHHRNRPRRRPPVAAGRAVLHSAVRHSVDPITVQRRIAFSVGTTTTVSSQGGCGARGGAPLWRREAQWSRPRVCRRTHAFVN